MVVYKETLLGNTICTLPKTLLGKALLCTVHAAVDYDMLRGHPQTASHSTHLPNVFSRAVCEVSFALTYFHRELRNYMVLDT